MPEFILTETAFLLIIPPSEWKSFFSGYSASDQMQMSRQLDSLAQSAVLLAEYLNRRSMPQDHGPALKGANIRLQWVRKAMGYTYP